LRPKLALGHCHPHPIPDRLSKSTSSGGRWRGATATRLPRTPSHPRQHSKSVHLGAGHEGRVKAGQEAQARSGTSPAAPTLGGKPRGSSRLPAGGGHGRGARGRLEAGLEALAQARARAGPPPRAPPCRPPAARFGRSGSALQAPAPLAPPPPPPRSRRPSLRDCVPAGCCSSGAGALRARQRGRRRSLRLDLARGRCPACAHLLPRLPVCWPLLRCPRTSQSSAPSRATPVCLHVRHRHTPASATRALARADMPKQRL